MIKLQVLAVLIVAVLFSAFCAPTASGDWNCFRGDLTRNGYVEGAGEANSATQLWNYSTNAAVGSSPAVSEGRVVVGCKDCHIYCLNAFDFDYLVI
jgi:outer membrane protein assembly factor BamB